MSQSETDGRAESIRQNLRNALRARGEDVTQGLQRYAVERFLYRLGRSAHRERFVLKGATLFAIWGTAYRPTRDIDFTAYGNPETEALLSAFREICNTSDDVDQLIFDTHTMTAEAIRDGSNYGGIRIKIRARLGTSVVSLRVDVGFANAIVPGPEEREYRTILGDPPPRILVYPPESVVAEKLHAMVTLGEHNTRYKDFYDLYVMAGAFTFERRPLAQAVRATFNRRVTPAEDALPAALSSSFYANQDKAEQWRAYVTRNKLPSASTDFTQIGELLVAFLLPIWRELGSATDATGDWPSGGPWQ